MQNNAGERKMFVCKRCGTNIDTRRKRADGSLQCPRCNTIYRLKSAQNQASIRRQPPRRKSGFVDLWHSIPWKRKVLRIPVWLWVVFVFLFFVIVIPSNEDTVDETIPVFTIRPTQQVQTTAHDATDKTTTSPTQAPTPTPRITTAPTRTPAPTVSITLGERNALSKAKSYLKYTAFSYNGLGKQLMYEGFTYDEAKYAVDNCGADWYEQAAKKAASYLEYSSFSRQGLIEQLEYEEFTHDQAVYGVTKVGY